MIEYVGPTIAAEHAYTPLARVRRKLEETFGRVRPRGDARSRVGRLDEESLVKVLSEAAEKRKVVELEYSRGGGEPVAPPRRALHHRAELPVWRVHTWDLTVDAARTFA